MEPRRVLFLAEGQLGDLVILTPALRAMKSSFPSCRISVFVLQRRAYSETGAVPGSLLIESQREGTSVLLRSDPSVDEVVDIDRSFLRSMDGLQRIRAEVSILRRIRKGKFDTVICTFPEDRFALWAMLSGARTRIGQRRQGFWFLLTRTPGVVKRDMGVLRYYCALVEAAGAEVASLRTEYRVPETAGHWAEQALAHADLHGTAPLVAVHPGASGNYKIWPPERYAALLDHLVGDLHVRAVLVGTEFDRDVVADVRRHAVHPVPEIVTRKVEDLAALLKRCLLCICNNSGPRHLAAAVGTRTLAILPRTDIREWKIYENEREAGTLFAPQDCTFCPEGECRNRMADGDRYGSYCVRTVEVTDVLRRVKGMLSME